MNTTNHVPRRLAGIALVAALAVGATACGGDDDDATDDGSADAGTEVTEESGAGESPDATESADDATTDEASDDTSTTTDDATTDEASDDASATTEPPSADTTEPAAAAAFPVTIEHALGSTEIPAQPERVVSASGTMTGHLLAIDVPVVAAQVLPPQSPLTDDSGFLIQWGDVATEQGVEPMAGPEVNIEAIAATDPDLIVGNSFGGDAITEDVYALLSEVAPTIVIDHSAMEWQELAAILAEATGHQADADAAITAFDAHVDEVGATLDTTYDVVTGVITEQGVNMFTLESSHGKLLDSLGLTVREMTGTNLEGEQSAQTRGDVVSVSPELIPDEFGDASVMFVFAEDEDITEALDIFPTLGATPAASEDRLYPLGIESFRLDMYSATSVVDRVGDYLGG